MQRHFPCVVQLRGAVPPRVRGSEMKGRFPKSSRPNPLSQTREGCPWLGHGRGWQWGWLVVVKRRWKWEREGRRQRASLRGGGFRGTASPAQPCDRGWEIQEQKERGHSQEKSPRSREARAANRAMDLGLQLGPPSVRKGSGESYPDPSGTEQREKRKTTKHLN